MATRQLPPRKTAHRLELELGLRLVFGLGEQFSSGEIVIEHFKSDEKCFLFHVKSFFRSQDIKVYVLTFWSCSKTT